MKKKILLCVLIFVLVVVVLFVKKNRKTEVEYDSIDNIVTMIDKQDDQIRKSNYTNLNFERLKTIRLSENVNNIYLFEATRNNRWDSGKKEEIMDRVSRIGKE